MIQTSLHDKKLETRFRILCIQSGQTIKERLALLIERDLLEQEAEELATASAD